MCAYLFLIAASNIRSSSGQVNAKKNKVAFKSTFFFFVNFADFANVQPPSNKQGGSLSLSVVTRVIVRVVIFRGEVPDFALLGCVVDDDEVSDLHLICVSTFERRRRTERQLKKSNI